MAQANAFVGSRTPHTLSLVEKLEAEIAALESRRSELWEEMDAHPYVRSRSPEIAELDKAIACKHALAKSLAEFVR